MNRHMIRFAAALSLLVFSPLAQNSEATAPPQDSDHRVLLKFGEFDPKAEEPNLPSALRGGKDTKLWIVQFAGLPTEAGRRKLLETGAEIHSYLPHNAYVVRMPLEAAARAQSISQVRWVGYYAPAYRLETVLIAELGSGLPMPERKYNIVVTNKHTDKPGLAQKIQALGGQVDDHHDGSILFTVTLDAAELLAAARLDEVLWIDRWSPIELDMNNARIQGGGNHVEVSGGYTGKGVIGHVFEGVQANHPDFSTVMVPLSSCSTAQSHGHCTAGIVFGNGTSDPRARGMAPDAVGFYTNYTCTTGSRNTILGNAVNTNQIMFTTASWGNARTTQYTSISADADDIIFDHRIPWTQSQSNAGNRNSRPQAWAKNIFSIGGVAHGNNSNPLDDSWQGGNGSTGPAADGRIKPDLCAYYDAILTSDRTGSSGYSQGNFTTNFGGTSGATPIVAGHNALAIQMFTDGIFGNKPRVPNGTRFQNRPLAQTLKSLMIANAKQYSFTSTSTDNRREHQGWGFPDLKKMYDDRKLMFLIPEDEIIAQGKVHTYSILVPNGQAELKSCLTFVDPMGNPSSTLSRVNDLSLKVTSPSGTVYWGNNGLKTGNYSQSGGAANTVDTVENVFIKSPAAGTWRVQVFATLVAKDTHLATPAVDATYALTVVGGIEAQGSICASHLPSNTPDTGTCDSVPFGGIKRETLATIFANDDGGFVGGMVFFDLLIGTPIRLDQFALNTSIASGTSISADIYLTAPGFSYKGNEGNASAWTLVGSGSGKSEGVDKRSYLSLNASLVLQPGIYGIAFHAKNFNHRYTKGNGLNHIYQNTTMLMTHGSATNFKFFGGAQSPVVANVELKYVTFQSSSLQSTFTSTSGGSAGGAVYFDADVTTPLDLSVLSLNSNAALGTAISADIYITAKNSSYVGNITKAAAWTKVSTAKGTSAGPDQVSPLVLGKLVSLAQGKYGIAIVATGFGHRFTQGNGSNQSYSNSHMSLSMGAASNTPFSGTINNGQVANLGLTWNMLPQTFVNQRYQTIIRQNQLYSAGAITSLAFAACGTGTHKSSSLIVRMSQVPVGWAMSKTFASNLPKPVTVLAATNYTWHVVDKSWNAIGLAKPFQYNGTTDIVVDITVVGNTLSGGTTGFHSDNSTPRLVANGWGGTVPTTAATSDNKGSKLRFEFGCANVQTFGTSCGGLTMAFTGLPTIGKSYDFKALGGQPLSNIWLNVGLNNSAPLYPLNLSPFGFTDCYLWHGTIATGGFKTDASGTAAFTLPTPNNPNLVGATIYGQWLQLDPSAPGGAIFSNYGRAVHGHKP